MAERSILVDRDGPVGVVRINRPNVHNALDGSTVRGLGRAVDELGADADTRAVVITGTGDRAFSAGADLDELADMDAQAARVLLQAGHRVMDGIERCPVPVIAAVNGVALGGGFELVLACTFPVLSKRASLGLPESGLGLIPGYGGTQRLPRAVGSAVAAHVMLSGARLDADRAYQLGLSPLPPVDPEDLLTQAHQVAQDIAARGPRASTAILEALRAGGAGDASAGLALESALAAIAVAGEESDEGVAAFRERRAPSFPAPQPPGPAQP